MPTPIFIFCHTETSSSIINLNNTSYQLRTYPVLHEYMEHVTKNTGIVLACLPLNKSSFLPRQKFFHVWLSSRYPVCLASPTDPYGIARMFWSRHYGPFWKLNLIGFSVFARGNVKSASFQFTLRPRENLGKLSVHSKAVPICQQKRACSFNFRRKLAFSVFYMSIFSHV